MRNLSLMRKNLKRCVQNWKRSFQNLKRCVQKLDFSRVSPGLLGQKRPRKKPECCLTERTNSGEMPSTTKTEKTTGNSKEDGEIDKLANEIREMNRHLVTSSSVQYFSKPREPAPPKTVKPAAVNELSIDEESKKGRFGWIDLEKVYLPYIFRYTTEKFISVRMVEKKLLNKFLQFLPSEVMSCVKIDSYSITEAESKLLNDINIRHCDNIFGKETFTEKDRVVNLKDVEEFYEFLNLTHKKLVMKKSDMSDRCQFLQINWECKSVVPYMVKNSTKYAPMFYFEGVTPDLKLNSVQVGGWDLAYLKFCCKVQGIENKLLDNLTCEVVDLEEIMGLFPADTSYNFYWPARDRIMNRAQREGNIFRSY